MEDPASVSPLPQELAPFRDRVADPEAARTGQPHDAQALQDAQDYAEKIVGIFAQPLDSVH